MPSAIVDAAFRARIASSWSGPSLIGGNSTAQPPGDGSPFLVLQYPVVNGSRPVLGPRYFEEGAARMVLNVQSGTGEAGLTAALQSADQLASIFRHVNLGNGVETFAPSPPIINDANDEGNYFSLSVIVPYRAQFDDGGANSPP